MEELWIQNARIVDPANNRDQVGDLLLREGRIAAVGRVEGEHPQAQVIDGTGLVAAPGLVDMHVHLRDPGFNHKEDILSGSREAAAGGFTSIACMPNTNPPCDSPEGAAYVLEKAAQGDARVYPVGCITRGMKGETLCVFAALKAAGVVAVSDDGRPVEQAALMQAGIAAAGREGLLTISHCEDLSIVAGGIMNEGEISRRLGVKGMDRSSEDSITAREIILAQAAGGAIHIAHVSTKGSVEIIRQAKAHGCRVTCETGPHYLHLTDRELLRRDANWRMNPPLRTEEDRLAVLEGLRDGTIDAIATDHAPHAPQEKADFLKAPNGIIGLETSLGLAYQALVEGGKLSLSRLIRLMSWNPACLLGIPAGTLTLGAAADVVLFAPEERWTVQADKLRSRSRNTPFDGWELPCKVKATILGGRITYRDLP